jgi:hypothetical protein
LYVAEVDIIYQNTAIGKVSTNDYTEILPFKGVTTYYVDFTTKLELSKVSPIEILQDLRKDQQIELNLDVALKIQYLGSFFFPKFSFSRNLTRTQFSELSKIFL